MRRFKFAMLALGIMLLLPLTLAAQQPATTEEPPGSQPTQSIFPTAAIPNVPTEAPILPPQIAPLPTALDATPAPVSPIDPAAIPLLVNERTDLELLANQALGSPRPNGWSGSLDINNVQLPILIRLDLELLAGVVMGASGRPDGWFGPVPSTTYAIARDIRHDLELLADRLNPPNVRPPGWAGADPLMRCDRGVQTLVDLLEKNNTFQLTVDVNAPDFCKAAELQASQFVELNLLNTTVSQPTGPGASAAVPGRVQVKSQFAIAFLSRFGDQQVGTVPLGSALTPVARSYTQFSKMVLVTGDGFTVFMDYRDTTLSDAQFAALQDVNSISATTACSASWCKAPSG